MTIIRITDPALDEDTRDTLALVADRIQQGAALHVVVWDMNRNGDQYRVTVSLFYHEGPIVRRYGITHALIKAGVLDRARPNSFHGGRHMGLFTGGGTPVAADTVLNIEKALGFEPYSITNWTEA